MIVLTDKKLITPDDKKLILLDDVYEIRKQKEKELQYYQEQLEKLYEKMSFVKKEINLTETIIDMIETESVIDIKKGK